MERTFNADRQFRHDVIVVYVCADCANENHTLSSIMASNMVKLPKYCWILLKYCKKIDLQPNIHLPHHEPPPSLITSGELEVHEPNSSSPLVITSSRLHEMNGTLFHRSWTRDHEITTSMERTQHYLTHCSAHCYTMLIHWPLMGGLIGLAQ